MCYDFAHICIVCFGAGRVLFMRPVVTSACGKIAVHRTQGAGVESVLGRGYISGAPPGGSANHKM